MGTIKMFNVRYLEDDLRWVKYVLGINTYLDSKR